MERDFGAMVKCPHPDAAGLRIKLMGYGEMVKSFAVTADQFVVALVTTKSMKKKVVDKFGEGVRGVSRARHVWLNYRFVAKTACRDAD